MLRHNHFLFCSLSLALVLHSCTEPSGSQATLEGRWELTQATRNQTATEILNGTYFQFNANGTMETNLPVGVPAPTPYELVKNEIRQKSKPPVKYLIKTLSDSTLEIVLEMRGVAFDMQLRKVNGNEPPPEQTPVASPADSLEVHGAQEN